jgi:general secretion pathway protein C
LWRLVAIGFVVVGASWTAMAFAGQQTTTRLIAAVERLDAVVAAMNTAAARAAPPPVCVPSSTATPATPDWPVGLGIMKLDETTFLVERRLIDVVVEDQAERMRLIRIVPELENGRVLGLRLSGVRPDSLLGHLGFQNGDRVQSINGIDMSTPENALETYARLRTSKEVSVVVMRRGSRVRLEYYVV